MNFGQSVFRLAHTSAHIARESEAVALLSEALFRIAQFSGCSEEGVAERLEGLKRSENHHPVSRENSIKFMTFILHFP